MKPIYLYSTPEGPINLMKAENMPVKPIQTNAWNGKDYRENAFNNSQQFHYEQALQAAKASSVPIQDQFQARLLIYIKNNSEDIKPDTIYGPFTVEYEIEKQFLFEFIKNISRCQCPKCTAHMEEGYY